MSINADVYLRRYFWVWILFTILVCAYFAARGVTSLLVAKLPIPKVSPPATSPLTQGWTGPVDRNLSEVTSRNIFCSACVPKVEVPLEGDDTPDSGEPVKTSLQISLVATMVCPDNAAWSFAAILDQRDQRTRMLRTGATIIGSSTIIEILNRRVILENNNRLEYLDLFDAPAAVASDESASSSPYRASGEELPEDVRQGVKKVGETQWEIQRAALEKVLSNTTMLARSARIVPSVNKDGQPNGFKLYAIRPGSMYDLIGLRNGDTINAINGHAMDTPDKALEVYTRVRSASHLSISFSRGAQALTHDYTIR